MKNRTKLGLAAMSGLVVAATAAITLGATATGSTVPRAFEATNAPHVTVSALPGVDLAPLARLPGLSASSGPYPDVVTGASLGAREADVTLEARGPRTSVVDRPLLASGTWTRPGMMVLEQGLAQALRARAGSRVAISTAHGPARLRVAGIAVSTSRAQLDGRAGIAYVTRRTLAGIAPNGRTLGSTLYLRLSNPGSSRAYAAWLRQRYPGPQVTVDDWQRLETPAAAGPSLAQLAALALLLAAVTVAIRRRKAGTRPRMRTRVARRA